MGSLRRTKLEALSDERILNDVYQFYDSIYRPNKHATLTSVFRTDNSEQIQNYKTNGVAEVSISFPDTRESFNTYENILLWMDHIEPQIKAVDITGLLADKLDLNLYSGEQIPASAQIIDPEKELKALHFSFNYFHHLGHEEIPIEIEIVPLYDPK